MYYVDEYKADRKRYETMQYNRCGKSGLKLPQCRWDCGTISVPKIIMT